MSPTSGTELGLRIRQAADRLGSRKAAADAAGVSVEQLARYMRGENEPAWSNVTRLAEEAKVSLDWLAYGRGAMERARGDQSALTEDQAPYDAAPSAVASQFYAVPRFEARASAGAGAVAEDAEIKDHLMFRRDWIRSELGVAPEKLGCVDLVGDSMEPLIPNGATLLFDRSFDRVVDEAVYVLNLEGALLVKSVQRLVGGLVLRSENPRYPPTTLDAEQSARLEVIGRVRWFGRVI